MLNIFINGYIGIIVMIKSPVAQTGIHPRLTNCVAFCSHHPPPPPPNGKNTAEKNEQKRPQNEILSIFSLCIKWMKVIWPPRHQQRCGKAQCI